MNTGIFPYGKWFRILLHVLVWLILFIAPIYFASRYMGGPNPRAWFFSKDIVIYCVIFYTNFLILVPWLFFKGRKLAYILAILVLITGFLFVSYATGEQVRGSIEQTMDRPPPMRPDQGAPPRIGIMFVYSYLLGSTIVVLLSLGLAVLNRQSEMEKTRKELEKEKLNSELAFLKSQISPHFLFNTLNNIYSLIDINGKDAQDAVLKLSKLMRYILDESERERISLGQEIAFMNHYIDLMKLRLVEKVDLKVTFPENYHDLSVPPLLFIPFIENTFKHGVSYRGRSFIEIALEVNQERILFTCRNKIFSDREGTSSLAESGIGLNNARKRLNLLFPQAHDLSISDHNGEFNVNLSISCKALNR